MSIPAGVRIELEKIAKRRKEFIEQGFPPYIAQGKAVTAWEEEEANEAVKTKVLGLSDSHVKTWLTNLVKFFAR